MTSILERIEPAWLAQLRITVVIPTYNEADNLPGITEAILALPLPGLQVLVVDDNSPDGTGAVADRLAVQVNQTPIGASDPLQPARPRMVVIHRQGKGGLGTAYVAGMRRALEDGADFVVQMDADFSHSPAYIPQMLGVILSAEADVIVGSRYVPGGSLDAGWGWWRRLLSWWANLYSRMILGLRIRDMTAGFKLWRRGALQQIDLEDVRSNGYSFQVEMAYLSERFNYHIIELPIHFADRRIGQSKLDVPVKLESAWRTWQIRWRYRNLSAGAPAGVPPGARADNSAHAAATPSPAPHKRVTR
ncbi:MAG: polyprenol monophosphomannose synthase [Litorilinea sp.]